MKKHKISQYLLVLLLPFSSLCADEEEIGPSILLESAEPVWKAKLRAKTLHRLDKLLAWAIPFEQRSYSLSWNHDRFLFTNTIVPLRKFGVEYNYFSKVRPIISSVTIQPQDIELVLNLLQTIHYFCKDEDFREIATAEVLSKVLAYRAIEEGMTIPIPGKHPITKEDELVEFKVDTIFSLGMGMPAFGLVPVNRSDVSPILLFRGTDFSLESKQGWASVLSDLDINGPGLSAFKKTQQKIHSWLEACAEQGEKARVMGFSLGGVLAAYAVIYEPSLIKKQGSMAFNPPGVSNAVMKDWEKIPISHRPILCSYVTKGDYIPKIGKLISKVHELSTENPLNPIDAHVKLLCTSPKLYHAVVDLEQENNHR